MGVWALRKLGRDVQLRRAQFYFRLQIRAAGSNNVLFVILRVTGASEKLRLSDRQLGGCVGPRRGLLASAYL